VVRSSLALASSALTFACAVPYLVSIRRGNARPHRVSWLVFAALSSVAAGSQFAAGGGPGAWLSLGSAAGFTAIFVTSIPHGAGGASTHDVATLAVTAASVAVWLAVDRPMVALTTVIAAEVAAVWLSVRKTTVDPDSEVASSWAIDALAGIVAISAVARLSVDELLYPVHHTVVNLWMVYAVLRGRRRQVFGTPA
jgi:hypothetical protein